MGTYSCHAAPRHLFIVFVFNNKYQLDLNLFFFFICHVMCYSICTEYFTMYIINKVSCYLEAQASIPRFY